MVIARVKGKRREVRRMLAQRSSELLSKYRSGQEIPSTAHFSERFSRSLPDDQVEFSLDPRLILWGMLNAYLQI